MKSCSTPEEKKLATYFGASYVRGKKKAGKRGGYEDGHFKLAIWNLHQAVLNDEPTTNNFAEAYHRCIQVMLNDTNMTFSSFIEKLKQSLVSRENRLDQIRLGMDTAQRNAKSVKKTERIRKILKQYGQKTPMEILDMLAHNVKVD